MECVVSSCRSSVVRTEPRPNRPATFLAPPVIVLVSDCDAALPASTPRARRGGELIDESGLAAAPLEEDWAASNRHGLRLLAEVLGRAPRVVPATLAEAVACPSSPAEQSLVGHVIPRLFMVVGGWLAGEVRAGRGRNVSHSAADSATHGADADPPVHAVGSREFGRGHAHIQCGVAKEKCTERVIDTSITRAARR